MQQPGQQQRAWLQLERRLQSWLQLQQQQQQQLLLLPPLLPLQESASLRCCWLLLGLLELLLLQALQVVRLLASSAEGLWPWAAAAAALQSWQG